MLMFFYQVYYGCTNPGGLLPSERVLQDSQRMDEPDTG